MPELTMDALVNDSGVINYSYVGSLEVAGKTPVEIENQITTSVTWDLKNYAGVPVAGGVYLIHIKVDGVGSRVLKSFIINRALDAQKL